MISPHGSIRGRANNRSISAAPASPKRSVSFTSPVGRLARGSSLTGIAKVGGEVFNIYAVVIEFDQPESGFFAEIVKAAADLIPHVRKPALPTGRWQDGTPTLLCASREKPLLFDSVNTLIRRPPLITTGAQVRIAGRLLPAGRGLLASLEAVQVISLGRRLFPPVEGGYQYCQHCHP